ncbi:MAG: hypothetical protein ACYTKD_29125 [Planctomycetota bacterium]|jgi:hypothetical protein
MDLTEEQKLTVVEAFAEMRSVKTTASALGMEIDDVREVLRDSTVLDYARSLVLNTVGAEFYGLAAETCLRVLRKASGKEGDKVAAMRFLHQLMESERPKKKMGRPEKPKEAKPLSFAQVVKDA